MEGATCSIYFLTPVILIQAPNYESTDQVFVAVFLGTKTLGGAEIYEACLK